MPISEEMYERELVANDPRRFRPFRVYTENDSEALNTYGVALSNPEGDIQPVRYIATGLPLGSDAWRWYGANGQAWRTREMETTHVFYTLRLIWNVTMPEECAVGNLATNRHLSSQYGRDYLIEVILHLRHELAQRTNLPTNLQRELNEMHSWTRVLTRRSP